MTAKKKLWTVQGFQLTTLLTLLFVILLVQAFPQAVVLFTAFHEHNSPLEIHTQSTFTPTPAVAAALCLFCPDLQLQIGRINPSLSPDSGPGITPVLDTSLRL
jgi:hypothetical protein